MTVHSKQFRGKRAFSVAEMLISMALIAVVSLAGFSACYLGMHIQAKASDNVSIWNYSHMFRSAFYDSVAQTNPAQSDENVEKFILDFNKRISFAFNTEEFHLNNFQGDCALDGGPWDKTSVLISEKKIIPPENIGDQPTEQTIVISALTMHYHGSFLHVDKHAPSNNFVYRFYNRTIEIRAEINFLGENYLSVVGGTLNFKEPSYSLREVL